MKIVFCIYNFIPEKLPLQPWLTIVRIAEEMCRRGHEVHLVTDTRDAATLEGATIHKVKSLRGNNGAEVTGVLEGIRPEALVFLATPLNLATTGWLAELNGCRIIAFASYPFYQAVELWRAWRRLPWRDVQSYVRHLLVPGLLWRSALRRRFAAVIAQSESTADRLGRHVRGRTAVETIPPGIELESWPIRVAAPNGAVTRFLYLGSAIPIRGFQLTLSALARIDDSGVRLRVLARGAEAAELDGIRAAVAKRGLAERVEIVGGWIDRAGLVEEIHAASAVVLPFLLVPSELPVTVMEAIACGAPVIGSRIDGLPSTIGPAGLTVRQGSASALADAMLKFHRDASLRQSLEAGCRLQRSRMLPWHEIAGRWEEVLRHG